MPRIFITNPYPYDEDGPDEEPNLHPIFPNAHGQSAVAIRRRYNLAGPVERMLATPTSSWARFVKERVPVDKKKKEEEQMDYDTVSTLASDTGETSKDPDYSTLCKDLLLAARKHRGLLGYCKPSDGKQGDRLC